MHAQHKPNVILALKKSAGAVQNILKMVEHDRYCIDILQQINAAVGLLKSAGGYIVKDHLAFCGPVKLAAKNKKVREQFVTELLKVLDISSRK